MIQEIVLAAKSFGGEMLTASQEGMLEAFCRAAADFWRDRLREEVTPEECGGFVAACAWMALADFWTVSEAGGQPAAFTAGGVSVQLDGQGRRQAAAQLRQQAECLMLPYLPGDPDFSFRGVRG